MISREDCRVLRGWLRYWEQLEDAHGSTRCGASGRPPCGRLPGIVSCDALGRVTTIDLTSNWSPAAAGPLPPTPFELAAATPGATTPITIRSSTDFCGSVPPRIALRNSRGVPVGNLTACLSSGSAFVNNNECEALLLWTSYWASDSRLVKLYGACDTANLPARAARLAGKVTTDEYSRIKSIDISKLKVAGAVPSSGAFSISPLAIYVGPLLQLCGPIPPSIRIFRAFDGLPDAGSAVSTLPNCSIAIPKTITAAVTRKGVAGQISETGGCGPAYDNAICPFGYCCSGSACVDTVEGCYKPLCDPNYGLCFDKGSTGNEQPTLLSAFTAGDSMQGNRADKFFVMKKTAQEFCNSTTLPQLDPPRPCVTVTITTETPVIYVAAMYGTNPVILERDNPLLATYSRALNGNSSDGTAVGLLAVKKGCVLAVRPAEGVEARRFNPTGEARKGTLDEEAFPRPCWGFASDAARHDCFCSYHHHGSYVLPGANCSKVLACANGKAAGITTCPAGQVADDLDELSGAADCYNVSAIDGEFQCGDGCSSFACFCAEYLVPSFTPDARYLNPFDDTKSTALVCNASRRGWYGGVEHPSEELRRRFRYKLSTLNFHPVHKNFTSTLEAVYKAAKTRSSSTGCTGVPYLVPEDLGAPVEPTSPRKPSPLKTPSKSPPKSSPKPSPLKTSSKSPPKSSTKPSPLKTSSKSPPKRSPNPPAKAPPGSPPKGSPKPSPKAPHKRPPRSSPQPPPTTTRQSPSTSSPKRPPSKCCKTKVVKVPVSFPGLSAMARFIPSAVAAAAMPAPAAAAGTDPKPYWATRIPSKVCAFLRCCGDYPAAATNVGIVCKPSRCVEGKQTARRQASSWSPQRRRNCGAYYFGSCPVLFEKGCKWGNSKQIPKLPKGQRTSSG